jgi:hypothetical protein
MLPAADGLTTRRLAHLHARDPRLNTRRSSALVRALVRAGRRLRLPQPPGAAGARIRPAARCTHASRVRLSGLVAQLPLLLPHP